MFSKFIEMIPESAREWFDVNRAVVKVALVVVAGAILLFWFLSNPPVVVGDARACKVVILLHGYGADKNDLVSVARSVTQAAPDTRFILPQAPHSVMGGYSWIPTFQAESKEAVEVKMVEYRKEARKIVVDIINDVVSDGVSPHNIYLGGFSQGGAVALDVILNEEAAAEIGGLLFLSGGGMKLDLDLLASHAPLKAFVSHAKADPMVSVNVSKTLVAALEKGGHQVEFILFDKGHTIAPEALLALRNFMADKECEF
ncbi:MAG: hypothetical protein JXR91_04845 [Deltaproteobacteria bacterium]|nr:hypothetical protein [Deltaproteobacteria bacterium]